MDKCCLFLLLRSFYGRNGKVNSLNGDILISCHFNAYNTKVQGREVLYVHTSSKVRKLASVAQDILTKHLGLPDRGIKPTKLEDRGGSILNKTKPVAILIERFFLDNIKNKDYLEKSIEKVSNTIIEILEYIDKNKFREAI
ncbi:MAG: N-acetylmuramoyl-L-alanine amidase [Cetobacterium sp.]